DPLAGPMTPETGADRACPWRKPTEHKGLPPRPQKKPSRSLTSSADCQIPSATLLKKPGTQQRFVLRPAAAGEVGDGADTIIATVGGLITAAETGDLKPGTDTALKLMMDVRYYRLEINGAQIVEIDLVNGKRVIGGVDQLADIRRAMGL
ncbi:MAG: phage major tail tube protein, partial [Rhodobacter sp.]|nr:phage major tail tube protein [Rhodobacter sp.]MCA3523310.1 phage major tail tube protein [Rhodobacter sp.]MCA3531673.1 phage major tail tube protein [Rhodobacter sp.]MCA3534924.1 phage major tail tube protein [Rhodobacter sp.]MCA3536190.1 phage major tail tube protein [Rhodobacter sp.]